MFVDDVRGLLLSQGLTIRVERTVSFLGNEYVQLLAFGLTSTTPLTATGCNFLIKVSSPCSIEDVRYFRKSMYLPLYSKMYIASEMGFDKESITYEKRYHGIILISRDHVKAQVKLHYRTGRRNTKVQHFIPSLPDGRTIASLMGSSSDDCSLPQDATDDDVYRLWQQGERLQAIRLYRALHRIGLKEAKDAIGSMVQESSGSSSDDCSLPQDATDGDVYRLWQQGKRLQAIRLYRALHGMGLKEAKDAIESMMQEF